jgi:magnesium chelatase family protein
MLAKIKSGLLIGIEAYLVTLEIDLARSGIPCFRMVGLAEGAVRESKDRVFTALKNCGFKIPPSRITVNLAPADVKKEGSAYDLPLAIGILCANEELPPSGFEDSLFVGELSLNGELNPISGALSIAMMAREQGIKNLFLPIKNAAEASIVKGINCFGMESLLDTVEYLTGKKSVSPIEPDIQSLWADREKFFVDFKEVKGQNHAKRAIEIAAAGAHNILFIGPPGSGKTMLAQRIPTVLPLLEFEEALEVTRIYSVAGLLEDKTLIISRPFRSPHHTISDAGLIGGGRHPMPGEVSLAHKGVLFLDELPEFKKHVLEVLRQPLEDGKVTISRASTSLTYPAEFMLVAAMNPCPCGYLGDKKHTCTCTPSQIQRYKSKISGPLLDRIDLHIEVGAVPYEDLKQKSGGVSSNEMRQRIEHAREVQTKRYKGLPFSTNSKLYGKWLNEFCNIGTKEHDFLEKAVNKLGLSARAYTRVLRIARTIADLEGTKDISISHLAEAIGYRSLDRNFLEI